MYILTSAPLSSKPSIISHPSTRRHLAMRRHHHIPLRRNRVLTPPQAGNGLGLGIESQARLAIKRIGASARHALLVAGEAEHGQGDGDGDVDADLAGLDVLLEVGGGGAGAGEDGNAVAVLVGVDERDGVVDRVHVEAAEHRAEDLFRVALHVRLDVRDDRGRDLWARAGPC